MFAPQQIGNPSGNPQIPEFPPLPVPRIKPKHGIEWYQDNRVVKVRFPAKNIAAKKIDVFVSDLVLKVNIPEKKWVRVLDLKHPVDFLSKENTVVFVNDAVEVVLIKQDKIHWEDIIEETLSKEEIKVRRSDSFQRKEESEKAFLKARGDLKIKYDSHATREQMRLEDQTRNDLEGKKKIEKNQALDQIYKGIDDQGEIQKEEPSQNSNEQQEGTIQTVEPPLPKKKEPQQPQIIWTHKYDENIFRDDDIFTTNDLAVSYEEEKPKVREQIKLDIGFTQRIYPGVAAREQHFKDAPVPKIKQSQQEKSGDDLENKNPLWLKDRGDEFYKNQDYYSAIMAYNQAYKLDQTMITCISNRCACNIHLFNYEEALFDADKVLQHWESLKEEDKSQSSNQKMRQKTLLRKAMAISWKGDVERSQQILEKALTEDKFVLEQFGFLKQFECAKIAVDKRSESISLKRQGDSFFKAANYQAALEKYFKSIDIDENETAMGNVSLTYLKMDQNEDCINFCNKCIKKVQQFTRFANFNPVNRQSSQDSSAFLIKLYLRKAKAQQNLKQIKEAFETIKLAVQINDKNSEAKEIYKNIEKSFVLQEVADLKAQAANLLKENQVNEALEVYNECLKKIDSSETIEYLAVLLNRCICFLKLENYEEIITTCLRGLKIIRSYKNRVISWTNSKLSKEDKDKLVSFESRFLVRRANAYLIQNMIYNAKTDLEEALKLDPTNAQIKQDLLKVDQRINI